MALGRRTRPSLLRSATRAAVIGGTAAAAGNAVNARAQAQAQPQPPLPAPAPAAPAAAPAAEAVPAPASAVGEDLITRLERLAALHAAGALTDEEFAALKAQAISG